MQIGMAYEIDIMFGVEIEQGLHSAGKQIG